MHNADHSLARTSSIRFPTGSVIRLFNTRSRSSSLRLRSASQSVNRTSPVVAVERRRQAAGAKNKPAPFPTASRSAAPWGVISTVGRRSPSGGNNLTQHGNTASLTPHRLTSTVRPSLQIQRCRIGVLDSQADTPPLERFFCVRGMAAPVKWAGRAWGPSGPPVPVSGTPTRTVLSSQIGVWESGELSNTGVSSCKQLKSSPSISIPAKSVPF